MLSRWNLVKDINSKAIHNLKWLPCLSITCWNLVKDINSKAIHNFEGTSLCDKPVESCQSINSKAVTTDEDKKSDLILLESCQRYKLKAPQLSLLAEWSCWNLVKDIKSKAPQLWVLGFLSPLPVGILSKI